jgi:hypothetical protein
MKYILTAVLLSVLALGNTVVAQTTNNETINRNLVQITGVTMTADSLRGVPDVTVLVKNQDRGVNSSLTGVFSLVCEKGDTLVFSALSFRDVEYVVPYSIQGQYFSMIQLMVQDTFYLPETIINPMMSKEEFDYAFKYRPLPDDDYERMRKNTDQQTMRLLMATMPKDGRENQQQYQTRQAYNGTFYGQQQPIGLFNPMAWNDFFKSWKRGDFRKKK